MFAQSLGNVADAPLAASTSKKSTWNVIIQVLIAALTALSGLFAGCQWAG